MSDSHSDDAARLRALLEVQQWWRESLTIDDFTKRVAREVGRLRPETRSDAA